jgi:hypothetical protein
VGVVAVTERRLCLLRHLEMLDLQVEEPADHAVFAIWRGY